MDKDGSEEYIRLKNGWIHYHFVWLRSETWIFHEDLWLFTWGQRRRFLKKKRWQLIGHNIESQPFLLDLASRLCGLFSQQHFWNYSVLISLEIRRAFLQLFKNEWTKNFCETPSLFLIFKNLSGRVISTEHGRPIGCAEFDRFEFVNF